MDKLTKQIIEQAEDLECHLNDDVETIFLPDDVTSKLLNCTDPVAEGRKHMSDIEREWFDLIEDFKDALDNFIEEHGGRSY